MEFQVEDDIEDLYDETVYEDDNEDEDDNKTLNTYEQLDRIKETVFSESNPEFIHFRTCLKEWMLIDIDISILQKGIQERKKKKIEMTPHIIRFMNRFKVTDLRIPEGKVKFTKTMCTKPMNKDFLGVKLAEFLGNQKQGEEAADFLLKNREKTERMNIRRVKEKDEKDS